MIVVTGATGQLGRLVIEELLKTTEAKNIIAAVRTPAKAGGLAERGVQVGKLITRGQRHWQPPSMELPDSF
jgi:uncharacterized protein YbjT (DUF2867 family)